MLDPDTLLEEYEQVLKKENLVEMQKASAEADLKAMKTAQADDPANFDQAELKAAEQRLEAAAELAWTLADRKKVLEQVDPKVLDQAIRSTIELERQNIQAIEAEATERFRTFCTDYGDHQKVFHAMGKIRHLHGYLMEISNLTHPGDLGRKFKRLVIARRKAQARAVAITTEDWESALS